MAKNVGSGRTWHQRPRPSPGRDKLKSIAEVSTEQEAYLRGFVYPPLMNRFGYYRVTEFEKALLGHCFGWNHEKARLKPLRTMSSLSQEEKTEFISWVIKWAAVEHGIEIPKPSQAMTN